MKKKDINPEDIQFAILATDTACFRVIEGKLHILLAEVDSSPHFKESWGVIGGLILPKETADQSVQRHLLKKAGIDHIYSEQVYTFSKVDRDPRGRVVSVAYMALAGSNPQVKKARSRNTKWYSVDSLPKLAYDHAEIIKVAIERLQAKLGYSNIAQHLLPKRFTLSQLQDVYEVILGKELDKRNFRKKVLAVEMVEDTGRMYQDGAMRPAALYEFTSTKTQIVEIL